MLRILSLSFLLAFIAWINTSESLPPHEIIAIEHPDAGKQKDIARQLELINESLDATNQKLKLLERKISAGGFGIRILPIAVTTTTTGGDQGDGDGGGGYRECRNQTITSTIVDEKIKKFLENLKRRNADLKEKVSKLKTVLEKKLISVEEDLDETELYHYDEHLNCKINCDSPAKSCAEATAANGYNDGAYVLNVGSGMQSFYAYCAHEKRDDKGWTMILRREDGSVNFDRNWSDYKRGFGNIFGEYWIGLDRLHAITSAQQHELWILMKDFDDNKRFAKYLKFSVAGEDKNYELTLDGYSGDAGDSFVNHNKKPFSTYDRDNDSTRKNCAQTYKGGWWYRSCFHCNLNGLFRTTSEKETPGLLSGIKWNAWYRNTSLSFAQMAIRAV